MASYKHVTWGAAGRILVVDGDEDHAPMLATVLQAQGYRVDIAPSAQAGLGAPCARTPTSWSWCTTACPTASRSAG